MPATLRRSRRLYRLSILIAAVTSATSSTSVLGQDDSVPFGTQPVVVSPANQIPGEQVLGEGVLLQPILIGPITSESTDVQLPKAETKLTPVPELPAPELPAPLLSVDESQISSPSDYEPAGDEEQFNNDEHVVDEHIVEEHSEDPAMHGGVTVPILMASDKAAKSTLELRPIAGPLFGRGRFFKQGLFRSSQSNDRTVEAQKDAAKYNPAIPKPPAYIPNSPSIAQRPTPQQRPAPLQRAAPLQRPTLQQRSAPLQRPEQLQIVQPQRSYQNTVQNQSENSDSSSQWSGSNQQRNAPLRDTASESVPEYADVPTRQLVPSRQPTAAPSLQYATPAESLGSTTPADVSVPSVQLNPQRLAEPMLTERVLTRPALPELKSPEKSEPILVSPIAPKRLGAKTTASDAIERQVPNAEVKSVAKKSTDLNRANNRDSIAEHMRRDAETDQSRERQNAARQQRAAVAAEQQRRNTNSPERADTPDASRNRQQRPAAQARVSDAPPVRRNLDYVGLPASPIRIQTGTQRLKPLMERTLQYFYDNSEIAAGRSNWGMMHAIMVYGIDTRLQVGNRHFSTIAWIAGNNICRGQRLLTHDANGIKVKSGIGLQGHQAQMLAIFSLCDVPPEYPLYADDMQYSMRDVINAEMKACKSGEELTFTLIGLSHYLDTDATWVASDGQRWNFERLINEELSQSIVGTACGGTHRLMGFAHALRKRRHEGKPITGQWARAEKFLNDFIAYTYTLQNRDGSMSTNWFEGRGDNGDLDRKIQTTGHMVELLLTVTPDSQLQDRRLFSAVRFLAVSMSNDLSHEWKIGPKGHALRSLMMYHDRVFKSGPAWRARSTMARNPNGPIYR